MRKTALASAAAGALLLVGLVSIPAQAQVAPTSDTCGGNPADYIGTFSGAYDYNGIPATLTVTFDANGVASSEVVDPTRDDTKYGPFYVIDDNGEGSVLFGVPVGYNSSSVTCKAGLVVGPITLGATQVYQIQGTGHVHKGNDFLLTRD